MQRRYKWACITIAALALLGALGYHFWRVAPIRDLALADARLVPASAVPDIDLSGLGKPMWKLELSGSAAWVAEVRRQALNSYPVIVRCDRPDAQLFAIGPYLDGQILSIHARNMPASQLPTGPVRYTVYMAQAGQYLSRRDPNAEMPAYDLATERMTLCIRIAGGSMHGAFAESNEVRIKIGEK